MIIYFKQTNNRGEMSTVRYISKITTYIAFIVTMFFGNNAFGTHIVGGNMYYKKIGPNTFEITLELRRDCFLGSDEALFDDPAAIGIFSSAGALQFGLGTNGMLLIPYNASDTLNNQIVSDCGFEGTQVCVEEFKYVQQITLPRRNGGYILAYQRCCRNGSLNNVFDPLNTGATYSVRIPEAAFDQDNSTPEFVQWPPVYICTNEDINFDQSGIDPDGDSLVYKLCVPRSGATRQFPKPQPPGFPPYEPIEWQAPYSLVNLLGGVPLQIDPQTGILTGKPNTVGQFLVGICIEEYRNGQLIGQVNRDFQYNVRVCSDPPTAIFDAPTENCDGLTVEFTNNSIASNQFFWNFDYPNGTGASTSTDRDPIFTFPNSGQYDVFLKVVRGSDKCSDSIIQTINVFDADFNIDFTADLSGCNPDGTVSYTFTDASSINVAGVIFDDFSWKITQNGTTQNLSNNPIIVDLEPGDFTVELEVLASNGCRNNNSKSYDYEDFVLQPDFDIELSGGCSSEQTLQIFLDDYTQDNNPDFTVVNRNWTITTASGQVINATGDGTIIEVPRENFNIKLNVDASNGCDGEIAYDYLLTDLVPTVDFAFSLDGCSSLNNNAVIRFVELSNDSVSYSSVIDYIWNINGTFLSGDTVLYEVPSSDTVDATLLVEFVDGCFTELSKQIVLTDIVPQIFYDWEVAGCPTDDSVTLRFTADTSKFYGYGHDDILWSAGTANNLNPYVGSTILVTIPKGANAVAIVGTDFTNGCFYEFGDEFYPGDFAEIELVNDTLVLCPNEEGEIVLTSNPAFNYTWSPTTGLDLTDPSKPIVSIGQDTRYTVTVSDGICEVTASILVDVLEQIDIIITGDEFTCDGSIVLSASGAVGPGTYQWSTDPGFTTIIGTDPELTSFFQTDSATFYVRYAGEVCFANPAEITVVNQTPELDFATPFEMCPFDTVSYKVLNLNSSNDISITWQDDPHILSGGNSLEPIITVFPGDTAFTLYFSSSSQFGCGYADSVRIEVGVNPSVDVVYEVVNCETYEVCFEVSGDFNGFPTWDLGDTTTNDDRFLIRQFCYTYPGPGQYTVSLTNASLTCPFMDSSFVIDLKESIEFFDLDIVNTCKGNTLNIPIPTSVGDFEHTWCDINGSTITTADTLLIEGANNSQFVLKVIDENGCPFNDTLAINTFEFDVSLDLPNVFCAGEEVGVSVMVAGGLDYLYEWSPADCIVSGGNTSNPIVKVEETKVLSVVITHPTLGCITTESFTIEPTELTISADADPDAEIYQGDSVEIYVVDQMNGDTYMWDNGATSGTQIVSPEETTTYTVTVTDEDGCTGVATVTIRVIPPNCEEDVFLPNSFSPNGDDVNNVLYVRSNFVEDMLLIIYDRWNQEVFRSTNINNGWDGTYKGEELSSDTYAFYLRATCVDGFTIERSGNINLLR